VLILDGRINSGSKLQECDHLKDKVELDFLIRKVIYKVY
jgi:hypothetical protein